MVIYPVDSIIQPLISWLMSGVYTMKNPENTQTSFTEASNVVLPKRASASVVIA